MPVCPVYLSGGPGRVNLGAKTEIDDKKEVAPGIKYTCIDIGGEALDPILVFEIDQNKTNVSLETDGRTVYEYLETYHPQFAINGGYFANGYKADGLVMKDGETLTPNNPKHSGILVKKGPLVKIDFANKFTEAELKDADFVLQSGPLIIEPGRQRGIYSDSGATASRTAVGVTQTGKMIVIITPNPITLFKLQKLVMEKAPDIAVLMNLDGGPSTFLNFDCKHCETPMYIKYLPVGNVPIYPNVLMISPTK